MKREQLICHSFPSWDAPYVKSTMELMKELAKVYDLLIIDYTYTWKDVFLTKYAPVKSILGLQSRLRTVTIDNNAQLRILSQPPVIPTNAIDLPWLVELLEKFNSMLLRRFVKKWLRKLEIEQPILVNALNPYRGLQLHSAINPKHSIYYSYDNIQAMAWAKTRGSQAESDYVKKVDKVITSSSGLASRLKQSHNNLHVVHNGFNDKVFYPRAKTENHKHIDYLGAVDYRLDIKLIKGLCRELPDYKFRFIGPIKHKAIKKELAAQNVTFYDSLPQKEAAALLQSSSLCIIPFLANEFTQSIYPLKINEYLALGKPVVSTAFADLAEFKQLISVANTSKVFAAALVQEVKTDNPASQQARMRHAATNSWENRGLEFHRIIAESR